MALSNSRLDNALSEPRIGAKPQVDRDEWFRTLVQIASDLIVVLGMDAELLYANPAAERLLGFSTTSPVQRNLLELVHPDDRPRMVEAFSGDLLRPGTNTAEMLRVAAADGGWRTLDAVLSNYLHDPTVAGIVVNARDLSTVQKARSLRHGPGNITEQVELHSILQDRVKELTCLVAVGRAVRESDDAGEICVATAAALVLALRHPDLAVVSVALDEHVYCTDEGQHTDGVIVPITIGGRGRGRIQASYAGGGGDILAYEMDLMNAVGTGLAIWLEQRDTSVALAESEARFRRMVDNVPGVVFRYRSRDHQGFDYVSPSVETFTGYTAEEFMADPQLVYRLVAPAGDGPAAVADGVTAGTTSPIIEVVHRDGSRRWMEHHTVPILDGHGDEVGFEGVARDVTERTLFTHALEQRAREQGGLARFGEAALLTNGVADLLQVAVDVVMETLPIQAAAVSEVRSEEGGLLLASGLGWPDGLVGHSRLPMETGSMAAAALARDEPVVVVDLSEGDAPDAPFLTGCGMASGMSVVIGGRDAPFGVLGAFSTSPQEYCADQVRFLQTMAHILGAAIERTNAEGLLESSERNFRTLAENLPDVVARLDREHRHIYINPRVETLLGVSAASLIGKTSRAMDIPPNAIDAWEGAVEEVFISGEPTALEVVIPQMEGSTYLQSLLIPEFDHDGEIRTLVGVTRDITPLRHAEEQRREALTRIVAAQEEERARIGEDIHDDSIQVMTAVGMRLEGLKRQILDPDALRLLDRLEGVVRQSINRLRLLMFELRPPELDRDGLAATLLLYLETTATDDTPPWELVDHTSQELPVEMRVVLYRIALEAITNVTKHADASRLDVILDEINGGVRLRVRDDGVGFDPDTSADVGLHHVGTTAMRERAEAAAGRVEIVSEIGAGTAMTAWVPFDRDRLDAA